MPLTLCSPVHPPTKQEREGTRASEKRIGWKRRSNSLINGIRRYLWDFAPFSSFSTDSPFVQPSSLFRFLFNARPSRPDTPPEELLARLKDCTGLYYYYVYIWTTYVAEYYLLLIIVRPSDTHGMDGGGWYIFQMGQEEQQSVDNIWAMAGWME